MKFDKSKVYTAVNADELGIGDVVFAADSLAGLKRFDASYVVTIACILNEKYTNRFRDSAGESWMLAYLIAKHDDPYKEFKKAQAKGEVPEKLKLKWTDLKIGDVIQKDTLTAMVTCIDSAPSPAHHIYAGDYWYSNEELSEWKKVK